MDSDMDLDDEWSAGEEDDHSKDTDFVAPDWRKAGSRQMSRVKGDSFFSKCFLNTGPLH
jgi:hypothetical protein